MKSFNAGKRALIVISILLAFSSTLHSQNHFGIYIGAGVCKELNNLITTYYKHGFEAECIYKISFRDYMDFRVMAGYKQRGFFDRDVYYWKDQPDITNFHLFSLGPDIIFPVYHGNGKLYLVTGLRGNYLHHEAGSKSIDYSSYLDKLQLEANAGIGWEFPPGMFCEGIVSGNCLNKASKTEAENMKAYDFYFGLSVGYYFQKKKKNKQ
jgi:hypothetical protein